jgi:hypothetical protein
MSAANPNPMEKSMVSVLVVANAWGGSPLLCATTHNFTLQLLFKTEIGIMALINFARITGLGYCKIVRCRTTPLENDEERMDMGIAALGFAAFDG